VIAPTDGYTDRLMQTAIAMGQIIKLLLNHVVLIINGPNVDRYHNV